MSESILAQNSAEVFFIVFNNYYSSIIYYNSAFQDIVNDSPPMTSFSGFPVSPVRSSTPQQDVISEVRYTIH